MWKRPQSVLLRLWLFVTWLLVVLSPALVQRAALAAAPATKVYDFIVAGAGPAGAGTALELVKQAEEAGLPPPRILILENRDEKGSRQNPLGYNKVLLERIAYLGGDFSGTDSNFVRVREFDSHTGKWTTRSLHSYDVSAKPGVEEPWRARKVLRPDMTASQLVPIRNAEDVLRGALAKHPPSRSATTAASAATHRSPIATAHGR
jgi:hypothetical protein